MMIGVGSISFVDGKSGACLMTLEYRRSIALCHHCSRGARAVPVTRQSARWPSRAATIATALTVRHGLFPVDAVPRGRFYSPRPVRIIRQPSLSRLSMSALAVAVIPQATLCALHASKMD